jgi:hypothetical protein
MAVTWSSIQVLPAVSAAGTDTETTGVTQSPTVRLPAGWNPFSYTIGTGANSANKVHAGVVTLAANANTTIDLTNMSYGFGDASLAKVKGWFVSANAAVTMGNAGTTPFPFKHSANTTTTAIAANAAELYYEPSANGVSTTNANNILFVAGNANASITLVVLGE